MTRAIQTYRQAAIGTPLGEDVLLLRGFRLSETLGRPFEGDLDLFSEDPAIDFSKITGQNVTVRLQVADDATRYFNGYISRFSQGSRRLGRYTQYRATFVPWLWFLTRTADCRIFQNKAVPDIVRQILVDRGFTDVEVRLSGTYPPRDYLVQYRETDLNFISRLMEREGIYYYFLHEDGKHKLVLADSPAAHQPYPGYAKIAYRAAGGDWTGEYVSDWAVEHAVQPGSYSLNDFDFTAPKKPLVAISMNEDKNAAADFQVFDYPGAYTTLSEGNDYAKVRIEEFHARHEVASGTGDARGIAVGSTFELTDLPREDQLRQYLVTSATYEISNEEFESGSGGDEPVFNCHFGAIDAKTTYRPGRATPKPVVQGPQTAIVVGPKGEEIYTDQYGRVKVKFHWDRQSKADEKSSCWMRVAQVWAGKKWGGMFTPRIGQEVIVEHLEGDPDQPIITGRVYNGDNMAPYPLPDNATMSGIKTLSSKGGGGFNEIRFEDKKGSEQLFVHAEKDQDVRVKNDAKEYIGNDRHLIVKNDQLELVKGDKHAHVKGDHNEKVDGTMSLNVGQNLQEKVGMNHGFEAGMEIHLKSGMNVVIEAGLQLTLKAGANSISIGPAGVSITGTPMVMINSGGAAGSGSGASPTSPKDAKEAADAEPGQVEEPPEPGPPPPPVTYASSSSVGAFVLSPAAQVLSEAARSGTPFCEVCERAKKAGRP